MTAQSLAARATGLVPGVGKIGVLRANSLGDFLTATPALAALRAAYPSAELVLIGAPWHARTLQGRPGPIDRVMLAPALPGIRAAEPGESTSAESLMAAARKERFDVAIQLHGGGRNSNPIVRDLGARLTVGLRATDAPPLDRWLRYDVFQPEVFRYLEVVELIGATPVMLAPSFTVTDTDRREALAAAGPTTAPRVALHPGATDPRRRWPAARFAAVGDALAGLGYEVVITGTSSEREIIEAVRARMRHPARPLVDALSVGGLAALYESCALVVGNDTGPLHLAAAVGTATVGLYWAGNAMTYAPATRGAQRSIISWTVHCPRCSAQCTSHLYPHRDGNGCGHRDSLLLDIPVAEVVDAAMDLLSTQPPPSVQAETTS